MGILWFVSSAPSIKGEIATYLTYDGQPHPPTGGGSPPAGVLHELAVTPIASATNGHSLNRLWTSSRALIIEDKNPAGSKDLFGIIKSGEWNTTGDQYYMLLSTDHGQSWTYLTASGGPNADSWHDTSTTICQDTVSYKAHILAWPQGNTAAVYSRIVLSYTANHISGFTWEAAGLTGPNPSGGDDPTGDGGRRLHLREVINGSGAHTLMYFGLDQVGTTMRLVTGRADTLTPANTAAWLKLTDGTAGYDIVFTRSEAAGTNGGTLPYAFYNSQLNCSVHESDCCFAQLGTTDVNAFVGPLYFNDATTNGDLRRVRFTQNGANWTLDASVNCVVVSPVQAAGAKPCMGNCVGTTDRVWFTWGTETGLRVGYVDNTGALTEITQPDTNSGAGNEIWWWSSIGVQSDNSHIWAFWESYDKNAGTPTTFKRGIWDGATWTVITDDSAWKTGTPVITDAAIWAPIELAQGVGVMIVDNSEWNSYPVNYHIHVASVY